MGGELAEDLGEGSIELSGAVGEAVEGRDVVLELEEVITASRERYVFESCAVRT